MFRRFFKTASVKLHEYRASTHNWSLYEYWASHQSNTLAQTQRLVTRILPGIRESDQSAQLNEWVKLLQLTNHTQPVL